MPAKKKYSVTQMDDGRIYDPNTGEFREPEQEYVFPETKKARRDNVEDLSGKECFDRVLGKLLHEASVSSETARQLHDLRRQMGMLKAKYDKLGETFNDVSSKYHRTLHDLNQEKRRRSRGTCCVCLEETSETNSVHACEEPTCDSWMHLKCFMEYAKTRRGWHCAVCRQDYPMESINGTNSGYALERRRSNIAL
jgi:hypothetical protein